MLLSKKLVIWGLSAFLVSNIVSAAEGRDPKAVASPPVEMMSDADVMKPDQSGNQCARNPEQVRQILEQLEGKTLCTDGLTKEECHALYLATAAGGASVGGAIATRKMLIGNRARVTANTIDCEDIETSGYWMMELFLNRAYAGQFCRVRSRTPATLKAEEIRKKLMQELDSDMERAFASSEIAESKPQSPSQIAALEGKRSGAQAKLELEVKKYLEFVERQPISSEFTEGVKSRLVNNLKIAIATSNNTSMIALVDFSSGQFFPKERSVDLGRLQVLNREVKETSEEIKSGRSVKAVSAQEVADRRTMIENLKGDLMNRSLGEEYLNGKLKVLKEKNPSLDADAILKSRNRWMVLQRNSSLVANNLRQFSFGKITEEEFLKSMSQINYKVSDNPMLANDLQDMAELAAKQIHKKGLSISGADLRHIESVMKGAAKSILAGGGKAVLAGVNPGELAVQAAVLGMPMNCAKNDAMMTAAGRDPRIMVGYNYVELDGDTCKPELKANDKFKKFMELDPKDQIKLARYNGKLCGYILDMAKANFVGSKYQIKCTGGSNFTMTESGSNKLVDARVQREATEAGLSAAEKEQYLRLNGQASFNHNVSVNGGAISVEYPTTTQAINNCRKFDVSLTDQKNSQTGTKCNPLTARVTDNIYDYAQIAKCCAGEKNTYCDVFAKNIEYKKSGDSGDPATPPPVSTGQ